MSGAIILMLSVSMAVNGSVETEFDAPDAWTDQLDADAVDRSRVVITFKDGIPEDLPPYVQDLGGEVESMAHSVGFTVITIDPADSPQLIEAALADDDVLDAEYDRYAYPLYNNNDLLFEWSHGVVDLPAAWDITLGDKAVDIHILDTGIDFTHADLAENMLFCPDPDGGIPGADFVTFGLGPGMESGFHGTHVAGISSAVINNTIGVAGASQSCITPVRVLAAQSGLMAWVANGIEWSTDHGAEIISMSLGGPSGASFLKAAVDYAESQGVFVVAAAGNDYCDPVSYPAKYDTVFAVAALKTPNKRADYSSCGSELNISAPGSSIWSTLPGNTYGPLDGTSMATPLVAGIAGLMLAENSALSPAQVRCTIEDKADTLTPWNHYGAGRINAYESVAAASTPSC